MRPHTLLNADPAILHWIEFVAGTSNDIILSRDKVVLAKAMLQEAEQRQLAKEESLETGLHVERLRVALAPHKMLPTEIWSIIFRHPSKILCIWGLAVHYEPLTFSHVCSRWRMMIRSEPSFWNRAFLHLGWGEKDMTLIKFWIDNFVVDSHPLSLSITTTDSYTFDPKSLKLLLSQQRIRGLDISEPEHFFTMPMHSFPLLEDLRICVSYDRLSLFKRSACFAGMEKLRNFTVHFVCRNEENMLTQPTLPWGHLTSLTIRFNHGSDFLTIPQAVELLKRCTSLQKCSIGVRNTSTLSPLTVHLPHLTDLYLAPYRYAYEDKFSLTHCLITPALRSLTLYERLYNRPAALVKPDIGHVVRHSGHCLHTLILRYDTMIPVDMYLELHLLPCLHTLKAPSTVFSDETLDKIIQKILLPNIQTLFIGIDSIDSLRHLTTLAETKTKSSPLVPRLLFLIVVILKRYEDSMLDYSYIQACSDRILACRTKFALHFSDFSTQRWANDTVVWGISARQLDLYLAEATWS
ncbi:hypothetical protein C0992_003026 [Termitomyces sp. T32_za158]|nr:hypothetical protein C0992_003026 [Termitomyces sp. T32_za158]